MDDKLRSAARRVRSPRFSEGDRRRPRRRGAAGRPAALAQDPVELTFWAWCPGSAEMAAKFTEIHPNIKVKHENVGQGAPHYVKLRDALKAGTGLPDVAQVEFNSIASFRALNALADMGPPAPTT